MPLPPVFVSVILPSLAAVLAAWAVQKYGGQHKIIQKLLPNRVPLLGKDQYATFVIGDLHGDVDCAKYWVGRTGLINLETNEWTDPTSHLVFLGDYVDKGPRSKQVVEYVKSLTEQFPEHITALMGNHELELLLDRDKTRWEKNSWGGGVGYFGLAYSSVHPAEYLNYLENPTQDDERIVEALYNASAEVYGKRMHQKMLVGTEEQVGAKSVLQFIPDDNLRKMAATRLLEYQNAYIDAYRSGTELGDWLEARPLVAHINDTIFVHGGVSNYGSALLKQVGVEQANQVFAENAKEDTIKSFITQTQIGQIMYDMLTFRGNHNPQNCPLLEQFLPDGATRLGVGHTPGKTVRFLCNDNFMALDSSLGRWFRNSGNLYCHGRHPVRASNGQMVCDKMNTKCEGQIIKLTANGGAKIIQ